MRVLLAGASGAVGAPLTRLLIAAGHEVTGISRGAEGARTVTALTALRRPPMRHKDMATTNRLREQGTCS